MPPVSIKFSGSIIEELSQKIPSSLFALNELIKNAYDAFSPDVEIKISPSNKTITISDKGNGMGPEEINSLFHISKSNKQYGHEIEQDGIKRLTQGSKGLGFLSAFKFGDQVEWSTCKDGVRSNFSVCKSELVSKEDVSGSEIPVTTDTCNKKGTIITVHASNGEVNELLEDLSDKKVIEKLAATILDKSFDIKIIVEDRDISISTKKLKNFKKEYEERQLFYVKDQSTGNHIHIYHKGEKKKSLDFHVESDDYSIKLDLVIFSLGNGAKVINISPLNRRIYDDVLYPLVYINRNLFNNSVIFNPELLRKKRSTESLPQMIGRIRVNSQSEKIEFNSDRTNFVENSLTKSLLKDLENLNRLIQTEGAELKDELKNTNTNKGEIPTGKAVPLKSKDKVELITSSISINRKKPVNFYTPSEQINLEDYIFQVKNSRGVEIPKSEVEIIVEDEESNTRILPSIEDPCEKIICFKYQDNATGLVSKEIILSFNREISNISGKEQNKSIFTIQSGSNYSVGIETVADIINAIDRAYSSKSRDSYLPLIACSIRSIFEIAADKTLKRHRGWFTILNTSNLPPALKREMNDKLLKDVIQIIILLKKNQKLTTKVSEKSGISYSTLNNLLDLESFKRSVKDSHIGAHQSTRYLSKPKIEFCADICGYFSVICDILINLDNNETNSIDICKVDKEDLNHYFSS